MKGYSTLQKSINIILVFILIFSMTFSMFSASLHVIHASEISNTSEVLEQETEHHLDDVEEQPSSIYYYQPEEEVDNNEEGLVQVDEEETESTIESVATPRLTEERVENNNTQNQTQRTTETPMLSRFELFSEYNNVMYTSWLTGQAMPMYVALSVSSLESSIQNGKIVVQIPVNDYIREIVIADANSVWMHTKDNDEYFIYLTWYLYEISGGLPLELPFRFSTENLNTPNNFEIPLTANFLVNDELIDSVSTTMTAVLYDHTFGKTIAVYDQSTYMSNAVTIYKMNNDTIRSILAGFKQLDNPTYLSTNINELRPVVFSYYIQNNRTVYDTYRGPYGSAQITNFIIEEKIPDGALFIPEWNIGWTFDEVTRIARYVELDTNWPTDSRVGMATGYYGYHINDLTIPNNISNFGLPLLRIHYPGFELDEAIDGQARMIVNFTSNEGVVTKSDLDLTTDFSFKLSGIARDAVLFNTSKSGSSADLSSRYDGKTFYGFGVDKETTLGEFNGRLYYDFVLKNRLIAVDFPNLGVRNFSLRDYNLDNRLYYSKLVFEPHNTNNFIGNLRLSVKLSDNTIQVISESFDLLQARTFNLPSNTIEFYVESVADARIKGSLTFRLYVEAKNPSLRISDYVSTVNNIDESINHLRLKNYYDFSGTILNENDVAVNNVYGEIRFWYRYQLATPIYQKYAIIGNFLRRDDTSRTPVDNRESFYHEESIINRVYVSTTNFQTNDVLRAREIIILLPDKNYVEVDMASFVLTPSGNFSGNINLTAMNPRIVEEFQYGDQVKRALILTLGDFTLTRQLSEENTSQIFYLDYRVRVLPGAPLDTYFENSAILVWDNVSEVKPHEYNPTSFFLPSGTYTGWYNYSEVWNNGRYVDSFDLNNNGNRTDLLYRASNQFKIWNTNRKIMLEQRITNQSTTKYPNEYVNFNLEVSHYDILKMDIIQTRKLVTLLPIGLDYVEGSAVFAKNASLNPNITTNMVNGPIANVQVIYNFNNTGKNALIIPLDNYQINTLTRSLGVAFNVTFRTRISYFMAEGDNLVETFLVWNNNDFIQGSTTRYTTNQSINNASIVDDQFDLNNNGRTSDQILKSYNNVHFTQVREVIMHASVMGDLDSAYLTSPAYGNSEVGGIANYQIALLNNSRDVLRQFTVFNILPHEGDYTVGINRLVVPPSQVPRGSTFDGQLRGPIVGSGLDMFDIYYTSDAITNQTNSFLQNANWLSASEVDDFSTITAFKAILKQGSNIPVGYRAYFNFSVDIPDDLDLLAENKLVNSFGGAVTMNNIFTESNFATTRIMTYQAVDGYIFIDADKDGIFNSEGTDLPLANHLVQLFRVEESNRLFTRATTYTLIDEVHSDENGYYKFNVATTGNYKVKINQADGYVFTVENLHILGHHHFDVDNYSQLLEVSSNSNRHRVNAGMVFEYGNLAITLQLRDVYNIPIESSSETFTYSIKIEDVLYNGTALLNESTITIVNGHVELSNNDRLTISNISFNTSYSIEQTNKTGWIPNPLSRIYEGNLLHPNTLLPYINRETGKIDIPVSKTWVGGSTRPEAIEVALLKNGVVSSERITLLASNEFKGVFENIEIIDNNNLPITFSVRELTSIDRFTSNVSGSAENGFIITNTYQPQTQNITVRKVWDIPTTMEKPDVQIELLKDGVFYQLATLLSGTNTFTWTNVPLTDIDGNPFEFSVRELTIPFFKSEVSGSVENGFVITNTFRNVKQDVTVTKVWENLPSDFDIPDVDVQLLVNGNIFQKKDGEILVDDTRTLTMTQPSTTWLDVTVMDENGILYRDIRIKELTQLDNFESELSGNVDDGFILTNTYIQTPPIEQRTIEYTLTKHWINGDNVRPAYIDVYLSVLLNDGTEKDLGPYSLSGTGNTWTTNITLVTSGSDGIAAVIGVRKDNVASFEMSEPIIDNQMHTITMTNTYVIPRETIVVDVVWVGGNNPRPTFSMQLYRDGIAYGIPVTIINGVLHYDFGFLDMTDIQGNNYHFTLSMIGDLSAYQYTSVITGNALDGFVITHTYHPGDNVGQEELPNQPDTDKHTPPQIDEGDGEEDLIKEKDVNDNREPSNNNDDNNQPNNIVQTGMSQLSEVMIIITVLLGLTIIRIKMKKE